MCRDYSAKKEEARVTLNKKQVMFGFVPRARIRPTDPGPVILPESDSFACRDMRWGWQVPWDKTVLVNAKSETVTKLATFRDHLNNRCLLPADSFVEKGVSFRKPGGDLFLLAGLWRQEKEGPRYVMLTTTPNSTVAPHHSRMPLIVRPDFYDTWLGEDWER